MSTAGRHEQELANFCNDHHGWLLGWLRKKLGCPHSAADVAQDTFVRIVAASNRILPREPRAYLTTLASRILIDQARHRKVEQAYLEYLQLAANQDGGFPSPEQTMIALQALQRIGDVLQGLGEKPSQAFVLHYLGGETLASVGSQLGVSTAMAHKYVVRALMHCHRCLDS
ncbi:MAG: sigma-70 family RNA polymerase sigma factor [Achromobacter veterisilvae]